MAGIFTVSLDYELHWGVFDKKDRLSRENCYKNTLKLVPTLLDLFSKYNVHVTWATVGALFVKDEAEFQRYKPQIEPEYNEEKYSAYKWAKINGLDDKYQWAHFAPDSVASILNYPGQELGTHTFSHYYCMEPQRKMEAFAADLAAVKEVAKKFGNNPVSLVFPRNQFNPYFLKTCFESGIKVVRSNPNNWFWTPIPDKGSNIVRKVFRTGDGYFPMGKRTSYPLASIEVKKGEPIQLPASRLLRSWHPKYSFSNTLRMRRLLSELRTAAKNNECYHLWWHPENFGDFPEQNINDLKVILEEYRKCELKYGMKSWNMGEYADHLFH